MSSKYHRVPFNNNFKPTSKKTIPFKGVAKVTQRLTIIDEGDIIHIFFRQWRIYNYNNTKIECDGEMWFWRLRRFDFIRNNNINENFRLSNLFSSFMYLCKITTKTSYSHLLFPPVSNMQHVEITFGQNLNWWRRLGEIQGSVVNYQI